MAFVLFCRLTREGHRIGRDKRSAWGAASMPMFMDIHSVPGASAEDLRAAHDLDLAVQHKHDVQCLKYWFNEDAGKVFCLFEAPTSTAVAAVHSEAHGLLAEK